MLPVSLLIWLILEIGGYLYFGRHILGVDWAAASVGAVGGLLGGTQSLHTNSMDETLALPTEKSARIALRTQQVVA